MELNCRNFCFKSLIDVNNEKKKTEKINKIHPMEIIWFNNTSGIKAPIVSFVLSPKFVLIQCNDEINSVILWVRLGICG